MREWLFVISNPSIPNLVKIGHSEDHPEVLIQSYDLSGAAPFGYKLEYKQLLKDSYPIMMNIRKALWLLQRNLADGWYSISGQEVIPIIRTEVASYILGKLSIEIHRGGSLDFNTLMHVMDSVIVLTADSSSESSVVNYEAREIAKIIANILKDKNWMQRGQWLNRVTGKNQRYACSS